jgi:synaptobrevin family protein YKT6
MTKLYAFGVLQHDATSPIFKEWISNTTSFGYFQRKTVGEMMKFFASECCRQTAVGERRVISHDQFVCFSWVNSHRLGYVVITVEDYPARIAFSLAMKVSETYSVYNVEGMCSMNQTACIIELVQQYDDPLKADPLEKCLQELNETEQILKTSLVELYRRQESLDDLMQKSELLSWSTKQFLYKSQEVNGNCCVLF